MEEKVRRYLNVLMFVLACTGIALIWIFENGLGAALGVIFLIWANNIDRDNQGKP